MAELKKKPVRTARPPGRYPAGSAPSVVKRETARIVLPTRTPVTPIRRPPTITPLPAAETTTESPTFLPRRPPVVPPASTSPLLQPLPKPPGPETNAERPVPAASPESPITPSVNRGPKTETARISVLPRPTPTAAPAINMTKTQPLLVGPVGGIQAAPVIITSRPITPVEAIPRLLCWAILGISAVIFLIQIWNYVVS